MKLYATITSERATKGQGGNKYINFELTAGENQTVMLYGQLTCEETETENIYRLWNGDILVDTLKETKGKRQKGENIECEVCQNNCDIVRDNNDKIIKQTCKHCKN